MKLWPFASKQKALEHHLSQEIKSLQEKIDDNDLDEELREIEYKSFTTSDSSSSLGGVQGIVDEFYDKAMLQKLYTTETWFFIAVHTIAKSIAALPIKLEKRKKIQQNITQSDGSVDKIQKETWIDASAEPEYDVLTHPNSLQSSVEFWMLVVIDLMATGDAFVFVDKGEVDESALEDDDSPRARLRQSINKRRKTSVRGMYRLSSGLVRPQPSKSDTKVLGGYQINTEYGIFNFEVEDVIHIRLPNPNDPFFGLSPIIPVMKQLLLDKYSAEHMIRFYKQGARLGGVIETGKKLTKDQLTRLERVFESNFTGKRNHHKTLILPEGMKYNTIEQNPGETSLIDFLKANKEPILAAYNMPPVKVGLLDGATFANALIQDKTYYNDTIKPICRIVEESINQHGSIISKFRELRFRFSFDEIEALKEDETAKATTAKSMLDAGMSINEVREKIWKLPPVEGGKMIPVIEKNKKEPAPAPTDPSSLLGGKSADAQNDTATLSDIKPTEGSFEARVSELVAQSIQAGLEPGVAVPKAIEQALTEGYVPAQKTDDQKKTEVSQVAPYTKEYLIDHLKATTGEGVEPLIKERLEETQAFFKRLEKVLSKKAKAKTKAYKVKSDDISEDEMEDFLQDEMKRLYDADAKAMRHGYKSSISQRPMTFPNEKAHGILKKIGADHITSITNTTRKQINGILSDSFEEQAAPGEIASRIRDVFDNISSGRAMTIARTETLSAVSLGQDLKAQEFKAAYPKEAARMKRIWITAQDDRVRDSHAELDGEMVELGEEFANGLKFPRDPDGEAGEIINCRCTSIEYFPEDEKEIQDTLADSNPLADAADSLEEKGGPGSGRHSEGGAKPTPAPKKPRKPKDEAPKDASVIRREQAIKTNAETTQLLKETQPQFDKINEEEPGLARAIRGWSSTSYINIRDMQRGTYHPDQHGEQGERIKTLTQNLEKGFEKLPKYDGPISRELAGVDVSNFKEGGTFETDAFTSFTAKDSWGGGEKPSVKLVVPKNTNGRAIWGSSNLEDEAEVLVPKGTKYKISKIEPGKPAIVHLEEVGAKSGMDISDIMNAAFCQVPGKRDSIQDEEKGGAGSGRHAGGGHGVTQSENGQITLRKPKTPDEAISQLGEVSRIHDVEMDRYSKDPSPTNAMRLQHATRQLTRAIGNGKRVVAAHKN